MQYGKSLRIFFSLTCALAAAAGAGTVSPGHYTTSSVLADGHWVKVRVNETGIQQITHEQLRQWGFDDPSAVTVYGFGGVAGAPEILDETVPDDLPPQPVVYRDDRILFYGESNHRVNMVYFAGKASTVPACPDIERNHATDAGYYLITDSRPVYQPEYYPYSNRSSLAIKKHHWEISYVEEEATSPVSYGQLMFGPDFSASQETQKYSFPLNDFYRAANESYSRVVFHQILVGAGSSLNYTLSYPSRDEIFTKNVQLDASSSLRMFSSNANNTDSYLGLLLPPTLTSFDVEIGKKEGSGFTYAAIDRLVFAFPQQNNFGDRKSMLMCENEITAGQVIEIADTKDGLLAWNVDKAYNVRPYTTNFINSSKATRITIADNYKISGNTDAALRVIVFDPSKDHNAVEYAGEVKNQNLHANDVPDLIILSADAFVDQAERLAQIHRDMLGQDVLVLKQDEIFNEYSSGTPSLWGIRKAVKSFYDRKPDKLKYLLLFGASYYDNKGYTTTGASFKEKGALLLNYGTPYHKTMELKPQGYSCDAYFGMLSDLPPASSEFIFSTQHVSVGRLPVSDESEAARAVDKVYQYLNYTPTTDIYQRVLLTADFGDRNSHLVSGEKTAASFLANNPGFTLIKGYSGIYHHTNNLATDAKNVILQALNRGVMYYNFTGHGKLDAIGYHLMMNITDVHKMTNSYFPFGTIASCETYVFDNLSQSLAQELVMQSNGGMIGVVAACREVYQTHNEGLSEALADVFSKAKPGTTTGDIFRMARNELLDAYGSTSSGLIINTASYNLCGDPAVPLYFASHSAKVSTVNGEDYVDSDASHTIQPLVTNTLSGYVEDPENPGTPLESFNGIVMLSLYESPTTGKTVTFSANEAQTVKEVDLDEDLLIEVNAPVENGRFTVSFIPPLPTRTGDYNRATITAVVPDNSIVATTYTKSLKLDISELPDTPEDTTAPVISEMYLDDPSFVSGDVTAQNFTLHATIAEDGSGIFTSTGSIGAVTRIVIDGTMSYPVVGTALNNNNDGTYSITYQFTSFSDGKHTIALYTSDNSGNTASRSLDFIINNNSANPTLTVAEQPARIQATLSINHNFNGTPAGRLIIEDAEGNTVYTRDNVSFPFEWDLTDKNGNLVDDGVYRAYTICKGGTLYGATPKTDIVVIQKP